MSDFHSSELEVQVSRVISSKRWVVLRMITRVKDFSRFMPNVKESRVLEIREMGAVTEWCVDFDGIPIHWIEEDTFDLPNFTVHFKATEGDLTQFEGSWTLVKHPEGTNVIVKVKTKIGIPQIESMIRSRIQDTIRRNFEVMLDSIQERLSLEKYQGLKAGRRRDIRGFGILGHFYNLNHLIRYLKVLRPDFKVPSEAFLSKIYEMVPAYKIYDVKSFRSATGKITRGCIIASTFIPDMMSLGIETVFAKVVEACKVAEANEVGVVSLGGFTSIAGERFGEQIAGAIHVPVTTGNTLTVALAIQGIEKACDLMGIDLPSATLVVIGGTGDIGSACARMLCDRVKKLIVTARTADNLKQMQSTLQLLGSAEIAISTDNNSAVSEGDIVIAAASSTQSIVDINRIKPGAVVCDVGYPKNISYTARSRPDILIFSGGLTELPQEIDLGFDIGLPSPRLTYGCFAEAILLDLEERYESYSFGKGKITREGVAEITGWAEKHGFKLAPFFWGHGLLSESDILAIRRKVKVGR